MKEISKLTLGEIVSADYRKSSVLEKYGLDFCCGGNITLTEACKEKNLDPEPVIRELNALDETPVPSMQNYNEWKLDFLMDFIVNTHHTYVRNNLPQLEFYTQKIADVHGEHHPELVQIAILFKEMAKELSDHLDKEEQVLFPNIRHILNAAETKSGITPEPVSLLIQGMEREHDFVGDHLHRIAALSANYSVPPDGCNTYVVTFKKLKELEDETHQHVHLENNILFKKIRILEKELSIS